MLEGMDTFLLYKGVRFIARLRFVWSIYLCKGSSSWKGRIQFVPVLLAVRSLKMLTVHCHREVNA